MGLTPITFDAENRLTSSSGATFLYDGNSRRLRKLSGTTKIYFIYSATGRMLVEDNWTASTAKNQIYFNNPLVATHDQADYVRIFFKDHLGSTRSVAKVDPVFPWGGTWQTTEVYEYFPYGDIWASSIFDPDPTTQKYTGKERQGTDGLDYFGARYYDGRPAFLYVATNPRWISVDPITNRPYDPPSLNGYAYARNDPINWIDPDGRDIRCVSCDIIIISVLAGGLPGVSMVSQGFNAPVRPAGLMPKGDGGGLDQDWYNSHFRGVNTAIGPAERNNILSAALAGISGRVSGDCEAF